jgi:type IV pilus assembly protein PilA
MKLNRSKKGFTLVEIMIVVVIIGLLAAMAIPAFQKVRTDSIAKSIVNDARQIGAALQQIATEYAGIQNGDTIDITVNATTGAVTSAAGTGGAAAVLANEVTKYVNTVSKGYSSTTFTYTFQINDPTLTAFQLSHPQVAPVDCVKSSTTNNSDQKDDPISFLSDGKVQM